MTPTEGLQQVVSLESNREMACYLGPRIRVEAAPGVHAWVNWAHAGLRGTGVPILMLHGYPDSLFTWKRLFQIMQDEAKLSELSNKYEMSFEFELYALDLPGHGFTRLSKPLTDEDLAPECAAEFVDRFMCAIGLPSAVVVGNSFGGLVACHLVRLHPERVRTLVLIDPEGVDRPCEEYLDSESVFREGITAALSRSFSLATLFGVLCHPFQSIRYGSSWEAEVEHAIKELDIRENLDELELDRKLDGESKPLPSESDAEDDRKEHALLMRTASNYWTNRALVRRYKTADEVAYLPATAKVAKASNIPVLLLWGQWDLLFPCVRVRKLNEKTHKINHLDRFREWFSVALKPEDFDCADPIQNAAHRPQLEAPDDVVEHICKFLRSHPPNATKGSS